jgi:hypothetical protein
MEMKFFSEQHVAQANEAKVTTAKNVEQMPKGVWSLKTGCGTKHLRLRFWFPGQWGGWKLLAFACAVRRG